MDGGGQGLSGWRKSVLEGGADRLGVGAGRREVWCTDLPQWQRFVAGEGLEGLVEGRESVLEGRGRWAERSKEKQSFSANWKLS